MSWSVNIGTLAGGRARGSKLQNVSSIHVLAGFVAHIAP